MALKAKVVLHHRGLLIMDSLTC